MKKRAVLRLFAHRKVTGEWHRLTKKEVAQIPEAIAEFLTEGETGQ